MKIIMLVLNNITHDARVNKQASSLSRAGNSVTVIGLCDKVSPLRESKNCYHILRLKLSSSGASFGAITQLIRYFEFNVRAILTILSLHPQVCHAHAIQALPACWLGAKLTRSKLVYDAHEFEQGQDFSTSTRVPRLIQSMWVWPEKLFIHSADAVITVSECLADALTRSYQIDKPSVIRNIPEQISSESTAKYQIIDLSDVPHGWSVILYQGIFTKGRGLLELIYSADYLENLVLIFVGDGILLNDMQLASKSITSNVRCIFVAKVSMEELPLLTSQADVGVVLTQNTCLNHLYSLPNKLFEYIQSGLPVVGSNLPEISRIIEENSVGVLVKPDDPHDIARGIKQLLDPQVYSIYKDNVRQAARKYNWENESAKLIKLYQDLALKN